MPRPGSQSLADGHGESGREGGGLIIRPGQPQPQDSRLGRALLSMMVLCTRLNMSSSPRGSSTRRSRPLALPGGCPMAIAAVGRLPVDAVPDPTTHSTGDPASPSEISGEPQLPSIGLGPRSDRHAQACPRPAPDVIEEAQIPAHARASMALCRPRHQQIAQVAGGRCGGRQVVCWRSVSASAASKPAQSQNLNRHPMAPVSENPLQPAQVRGHGRLQPGEFLVKRVRKGGRPEAAHLRVPGTLASSLPLHHVTEQVDLPLGAIPEAPRTVRPAGDGRPSRPAGNSRMSCPQNRRCRSSSSSAHSS